MGSRGEGARGHDRFRPAWRVNDPLSELEIDRYEHSSSCMSFFPHLELSFRRTPNNEMPLEEIILCQNLR